MRPSRVATSRSVPAGYHPADIRFVGEQRYVSVQVGIVDRRVRLAGGSDGVQQSGVRRGVDGRGRGGVWPPGGDGGAHVSVPPAPGGGGRSSDCHQLQHGDEVFEDVRLQGVGVSLVRSRANHDVWQLPLGIYLCDVMFQLLAMFYFETETIDSELLMICGVHV